MSENQGKPQLGCDILVQCLVNHGVDTVFAYPGGASMPLHQALTQLGSVLLDYLSHDPIDNFLNTLSFRHFCGNRPSPYRLV